MKQETSLRKGHDHEGGNEDNPIMHHKKVASRNHAIMSFSGGSATIEIIWLQQTCVTNSLLAKVKHLMIPQ